MLLGVGAEAEVHLVDGEVVKKRVRKRYRHEALDERIRRERNRSEARLMSKMGRPRVIGTSDFEIRMEFVEGRKIRDMKISGLEEKIGEAVGELHSRGIAHNDLTTSNMIFDGEVVLIDFGLASRGKTEDFATDLKVLFEAAEATHSEFSREDFLKGYLRKMPGDVLKRLEKVYSRGRYIKRSR